MAGSQADDSVTLALPRSVCERLRKTFPSANDADALQRAILTLLGPDAQLSTSSRPSHADLYDRKPVGPEVHGGPEGQYVRESSTGRWRSVSRARSTKVEEQARPEPRPVQQRPLQPKQPEYWEIEVDRLQKTLMEEFEACEKVTPAPAASPPTAFDTSGYSPDSAAELAGAWTASKRARTECEKLWEAVRSVVTDPNVLAEIAKRDAISRALAEVEFEQQRLANTWEMMRAHIPKQTFVTLTRKANGCEGERTLSVDAARRLFEADKPGSRDSSQKTGSRDSSRGPSRGGLSGSRDSSREQSQSRSARLGRDSSREPRLFGLPSEIATQLKIPHRPALPHSASRPNVMLPPRPKPYKTSTAGSPEGKASKLNLEGSPAPVGGA